MKLIEIVVVVGLIAIPCWGAGRIPASSMRASEVERRIESSARAMLIERRSLEAGCASRGVDADAAHITCAMTPTGMKMRVKGTSGVLNLIARVRPPTLYKVEIACRPGRFDLEPPMRGEGYFRELECILQDPPWF